MRIGNLDQKITHEVSHGLIRFINTIELAQSNLLPRIKISVRLSDRSLYPKTKLRIIKLIVVSLQAWISANITYGLYLSDRQILDDIDTEMVVLSGIMIQNLKRETGWHLRGTRRVGVSYEDVETIQQCVCFFLTSARARHARTDA